MTPTRTCVGCRKVLAADDLLRVVRRADGELWVDRNGPGRGAWLCRVSAVSCLDVAVGRHGFQRALSAPVSLTAIEELRARLDTSAGQSAPDVRG